MSIACWSRQELLSAEMVACVRALGFMGSSFLRVSSDAIGRQS